MSQKRTRKASGMAALPSAMSAVRAASRGDLEDLLEKLISKDSELGAYVVDELTAVRAPAKPRVAETSTLTVGGTGAFDALNETLLLDVLLGLEPYERLEAMSACKGWLALRKNPSSWPALQFRSNRAPFHLLGGRLVKTVSGRTLAKFFVGPRAILPPMTGLVTLDVLDSSSNNSGIKADDWKKMLKDLKCPKGQLRELAVSGKVFKVSFYKECAKLFGSGLRELRLGLKQGDDDTANLRLLLSSCPRLTKLTLAAQSMDNMRIVDEELRRARGGGKPLLESLTMERTTYTNWNASEAFVGIQQRFPELVELRIHLPLDTSFAVSSQFHRLKRLAVQCRPAIAGPRGPDDLSESAWSAIGARATALAQTISTSCPKLESLDVALEYGANASTAVSFLQALGQGNPLLVGITLRNIQAQNDTPGVVATAAAAPAKISNLDLILEGPNIKELDMVAAKGVAAAMSNAGAPLKLRVRVGYSKLSSKQRIGRDDHARRSFTFRDQDIDATLRWL